MSSVFTPPGRRQQRSPPGTSTWAGHGCERPSRRPTVREVSEDRGHARANVLVACSVLGKRDAKGRVDMTKRRTARRDSSSTVLVEPGQVERVRTVLAVGGVPWSDLDDGVQQVRLKLLEQHASPTHGPVRDPLAWASVVASRVAVDWHRDRVREHDLRRRLEARWSTRPPPGLSEGERVLTLAVIDSLEQLPMMQRQVLVLRFYADLSVSHIANVLDVPEGTVKSRIHTAVTALAVRLREQEVIQ